MKDSLFISTTTHAFLSFSDGTVDQECTRQLSLWPLGWAIPHLRLHPSAAVKKKKTNGLLFVYLDCLCVIIV